MKHLAVITSKPVLSGKSSAPDGAINGNGDLAVILGNSPDGLRIYLSKCDLWQGVEYYNDGGLRPLGYIDIPVKQSLYDNYHVEQDMDAGEIRCTFSDGEEKCALRVFVCKTENSVIIENTGNVPVNPVLKVFEETVAGEKGEYSDGNNRVIFRSFCGKNYKYETHCYCALKQIGDGKWYAFAATNHNLGRTDSEGLEHFVTQRVSAVGISDTEALEKAHCEAWKSFWEKSSFSVSDSELENRWYASQYLIACCSGTSLFPPGLYGNFVTVETPSWHSDYHLNYNYQAPFYAACSSNHVELTDTYHAPLEDFLPRGREFAAKFGCKGVLYPVGLGPKNLLTEYNPEISHWFLRLFLGQKNNQIHPADILVFRWKSTRDTDYAREHAYPYVKACLEFFESYAKYENGRYSVCDDAAHEVPLYHENFDPSKREYRFIHDKNNVLTLGLLRLCLEAGIDMAKALGVDEDRQSFWQNMLEKLSPFPTTVRHFRRVFRYTEKGRRWNDGNDVGLQHIYPCGCIDLSSDKKTLRIARNSFRQRNCWEDDNAICSYYPMAARLGIAPAEILGNLRKLNEKKGLPNMLYKQGGGCLEDCSLVAGTLNEMAMQSNREVLRIFPCWDKSLNCEFKNLRADGAFLVSSEIKDGKIGKTTVVSEVGSVLHFVNPFGKCKITENGKTTVFDCAMIDLPTSVGSVLTIEEA